jgi:hypothetical protein
MTQFLVIFDTCQRPEYYQDLHNLLALPAGTIVRYEYRSKYIADDALDLFEQGKVSGVDVLLAYAEYSGYSRGDGVTYAPKHDETKAIVSTRIAKVVSSQPLSGTQGNLKYTIDLELAGYPSHQPARLARIVSDLESRESTPWDKWVGLSKLRADFTEISTNDPDNWASVVDQLALSRTQFADDVFWRIDRVCTGNGSIVVCPTRLKSPTDPYGFNESRFEFLLNEGRVYSIHLESHTPSGVGPRDQNQIGITIDNKNALNLIGLDKIDLRQYTRREIRVATKRTDLLDANHAIVHIETALQAGANSNWPKGASISLPLKIRKSINLLLGSLLLMSLGILISTFAAKYASGAVATLGYGLLGAIVFSAGMALHSGRLTLKS